MKSMTGFGISRSITSHLDLEVTLKSVNGRYFDLRFHLPREYFSFESDLKKELVRFIRRGSVDLYVQRRVVDVSSHLKIHVHKKLAQLWMKAYQELAKTVGIETPVTVETLGSIPSILRVEGLSEVSSKEKSQLMKQIRQALSQLNKEREREGVSLQIDILKNIQTLSQLTRKMKELKKEANEYFLKKMEARFQQLQSFDQIESSRLAQEVAILLERSDISEEIQRLDEHLQTFESELNASHCEGKKLEFYCQELLRETNTVGAKSQISALTKMVVEAKSCIEKIREQVQNVE